MTEHIALMGDSILDNVKYTYGLPDVVTHLRTILPSGISATLLAVDGSTTADVDGQVVSLPADVTHVVISMGGNDAILLMDAMDVPVASTGEALQLFGERVASFEASYRAALGNIVSRVPTIAVCTIYNPNLQGDEAAVVRVGLMLLNDVILRVAFEFYLTVIDLRLICVEPADFANPLEPSSQGAAKIAKAIVNAFDFSPDAPLSSRVVIG